LVLFSLLALARIHALAAQADALSAEADETLAWNAVLREAILNSDLGNPAAIRIGAIVHTAMFDAYNGVEQHYAPIRIEKPAPPETSARAAIVAAAHATLTALLPKQKAKFDAQRARSLTLIAAAEQDAAVKRGLEWGMTAAHEILAWRAQDGFDQSPPNFVGGSAVGQWRSTTIPPSSMTAQNMGFTAPFALASATQFDYAPPRGLGSVQWRSDFEEVKRLGAKDSSERTADQTAIAFFWNGYATVDWSEAAEQFARSQRTTRAQNARIFALLNIALADAAITTFNAKRRFGADPSAVTWRPITAIPLADSDGDAATQPDANWTPLIVTPNHPEYPASHPATHGAGAELLRLAFGDHHPFTLHPQFGPTLPTPADLQPRSFTSLTAAEHEGNEARIYGGMHYRSSVDVSAALGHAIAKHIFAYLARSRNGGPENPRQ
jgi:membrane-associated phospholipid phosphatase